MKKMMALTAAALVLAGCSQSDRNGMGSPSITQSGSETTTNSMSSGSYGTAPGQRASTNNTPTTAPSGTSGSGSAPGSGSGADGGR